MKYLLTDPSIRAGCVTRLIFMFIGLNSKLFFSVTGCHESLNPYLSQKYKPYKQPRAKFELRPLCPFSTKITITQRASYQIYSLNLSIDNKNLWITYINVQNNQFLIINYPESLCRITTLYLFTVLSPS